MFTMNEETIVNIKQILNKCNIHFSDFNQLNGLLVSRDVLLHDNIYDEVKDKLSPLRGIFSSSYMTSLQNSAKRKQRWPLLNLVRQILRGIQYRMVPVRKCDGYAKDGTKKFKRYFRIEKLKKTIYTVDSSDNKTEKDDEIIHKVDNTTMNNTIIQENTSENTVYQMPNEGM